MTAIDTLSDPIETIFKMLGEMGHARYGNEGVSQLHHALQAALQAEQSGSSSALIAASLLHDIGHLVADDEKAAARGVDAHYENVGSRYLSRWFPAEVTEPIHLHVAAKRYLCAVEPAYRATLSFGSERSLMLQGGPMSVEEVEKFRAMPFVEDAVRLRRWDEGAKNPKVITPPLEHYLPILRSLYRRG
jgi:[1-hydroxy-2-(trimethylamino)ethyl]phosphonate dioxygenase